MQLACNEVKSAEIHDAVTGAERSGVEPCGADRLSVITSGELLVNFLPSGAELELIIFLRLSARHQVIGQTTYIDWQSLNYDASTASAAVRCTNH